MTLVFYNYGRYGMGTAISRAENPNETISPSEREVLERSILVCDVFRMVCSVVNSLFKWTTEIFYRFSEQKREFPWWRQKAYKDGQCNYIFWSTQSTDWSINRHKSRTSKAKVLAKVLDFFGFSCPKDAKIYIYVQNKLIQHRKMCSDIGKRVYRWCWF